MTGARICAGAGTAGTAGTRFYYVDIACLFLFHLQMEQPEHPEQTTQKAARSRRSPEPNGRSSPAPDIHLRAILNVAPPLGFRLAKGSGCGWVETERASRGARRWGQRKRIRSHARTARLRRAAHGGHLCMPDRHAEASLSG